MHPPAWKPGRHGQPPGPGTNDPASQDYLRVYRPYGGHVRPIMLSLQA